MSHPNRDCWTDSSAIRKKISEIYEDIDAPSVVTVLLYIPAQVCRCRKFGCYVWVSTTARCYETASCLIEKHGQKKFRVTRGNGGCFAAASPNESSPIYIIIYIRVGPPLHQCWIRYWSYPWPRIGLLSLGEAVLDESAQYISMRGLRKPPGSFLIGSHYRDSCRVRRSLESLPRFSGLMHALLISVNY